MAILNFETAPTNTRGNTPFAGMNNEQPKSKMWVNIGYESNGKFINLPLGMPIDTMKPAEVKGQNEDWVKQRTASNDLLKALQTLGASFEPGHEETINLIVKLRRVNEEMEVSKTDNEYSADLSFLVNPKVEPELEDAN